MAEDNTEKQLDNNVLKLLACVKYKHPKINDIISDPEIYCLLEALLKDDQCKQPIQDILNKFSMLITKQTNIFPSYCKSNFEAIRENCNKENMLLFLYEQNTFHFSWNITTCIDELYELTAGHIMNIQTEKNSATSLCHLNMKRNKIKFDKTSKQLYKDKFQNLNNKIIEELKKIKVNNDKTYNQICKNIEKNRKTITENNKNCSPKTQASQQQQDKINKILVNHNCLENNVIMEADEEDQSENYDTSKKENNSHKSDNNQDDDTRSKKNNIHNSTKQQDGNSFNNDNIIINDKNNKKKKTNNVPILEDENENKPIENNQSSKWSLCKGCNCKCWPF